MTETLAGLGPPSALLGAAQQYLGWGLSVIPLRRREGDIPGSKKPDLTRWRQYQKRRPGEMELREWFHNGDRNIGVVCGRVSDNLVVLDFDDFQAYTYCFPPGDLTRMAPVVHTGKGAHVWLRTSEVPRSMRFRPRLPLDVKSEGGYACAPPSRHGSGTDYEFVTKPTGIPLFKKADALWPFLEERAEEWPFVEKVLPHWHPGRRHDLALGFSKLLRRRFSEARVLDIMQRLCAAAGDLEVDDRVQGVKDTLRKDPGDTAALSFLGEELYHELNQLMAPPVGVVTPSWEDSPHTVLADRLARERTLVTYADTEEVLVYGEGAYRTGGKAVVQAWTETAFRDFEGKSPMSHLVNEVLGAVRRRTYVPRDTFNPQGLLCLRNGVLDLETRELRPHATEPRFTVQLPVVYDPDATCPRFDRFLEEVLPVEGLRGLVQRLFGYCLEAGNWLQRAFMFTGSGNNGKSTLLGVQTAFLGRENVSAMTLQALSTRTFSTASLYGKLANIAADIPDAPVRYTGIFKMLTGGDILTGEKKFRDPFSFVNEAVLIFSSNALPPVDDRTYAFWRRWILIPFTQDFTGREDRKILEKLTTPEELSGVLTWALEGLRRLHEEGDFPADGAAGDLMEDWKRRSDSLYWFIQERVATDIEGWVAKADFNEAYATFCEKHNVTKKKANIVGTELPEHLPHVRTTRERHGGPQVWGWAGIRLREEGEDDG